MVSSFTLCPAAVARLMADCSTKSQGVRQVAEITYGDWSFERCVPRLVFRSVRHCGFRQSTHSLAGSIPCVLLAFVVFSCLIRAGHVQQPQDTRGQCVLSELAGRGWRKGSWAGVASRFARRCMSWKVASGVRTPMVSADGNVQKNTCRACSTTSETLRTAKARRIPRSEADVFTFGGPLRGCVPC